MAIEFRLDIRGRAGELRAQVVNMLSLAYTCKVNAPGVLTFTLPPEHAAIAALELDGQVEAWCRDVAAGIPWRADCLSLYRGESYQVDTNGDEIFGAICVGQLHWLSRRIVAYPANIIGYSKITDLPAETVMRTIVATNCTSSATVGNGRLREGALPGILVETDQGRGNLVSWSGPGKIVLSELQGLAVPNAGNGDFDLVKTGAQEWTFRFYPDQLGTDRSSGSSAVVFAREFDNMGEPQSSRDRVEEKTVAIAGGQGEEQARLFVVRTGPDYSSTNDIETFVDARNAATRPAVQTSADRALDDARSRPTLTFTPIQTPARLYGKHYFLGDRVLARYRGLSIVQKVMAAGISWERNGDLHMSIDMQAV